MNDNRARGASERSFGDGAGIGRPNGAGKMARTTDDGPSARRSPRQIIETYWLPRHILDRAWQILRQDGLKIVESTLLLGGRRFGKDAVVMAVLYPCGHDVAFEEGFVHVGADTTAEMGRWLRSQGLTGLMQVHCHPDAWTGHSKTDDDFPIASSDGFVSLVWPYYGALPVHGIEELGVHRLIGGKWYDLDAGDARSLIRVTESEAMIWAHRPAPRPRREEQKQWRHAGEGHVRRIPSADEH